MSYSVIPEAKFAAEIRESYGAKFVDISLLHPGGKLIIKSVWINPDYQGGDYDLALDILASGFAKLWDEDV